MRMKKMLMAMFLAMGLASCMEVKMDEKELADEVSNELKGAFGSDVDGEKRVSQTVDVKPFEQVSVAGSFNVCYQQGERSSVKVEGRLKDLRRMVVSSDGKTLKIKTKSIRKDLKSVMGNSMKDVNVYVTSPDLTKVSLAGSGEFDAKGLVDTDNLAIKLAGSGDVDFEQLVCDNVSVSLAGSGDVEMDSVDANNVSIKVAGSGDVEMRFVRADYVNAQVAGSGVVKLSGGIKKIEKSVAGSGSVDVKKDAGK